MFFDRTLVLIMTMQTISLKKLVLFWTGVVGLNAALCFFFGLLVASDVMSVLGMVVGVLCFIAFYTFVDYQLLRRNQLQWHKALRQSSWLKALLQGTVFFHFSIEFFCGFLALAVLEGFFKGLIPPFWHSLFATLITGLLLSFILLLISVLLIVIKKFACNPHTQGET